MQWETDPGIILSCNIARVGLSLPYNFHAPDVSSIHSFCVRFVEIFSKSSAHKVFNNGRLRKSYSHTMIIYNFFT